MSRRHHRGVRDSAAGAEAARGAKGGDGAAAFAIIAAGIAAALGVAPLAANADRLDYFALFGEWSVICAADEAAGERTCAIEAPPLDPNRPRNAIEVRRAEDGAPEIAIRRRAMVNAATPVFLRIDANPAHRAVPTPSGEVLWLAVDATEIIEQLRTGNEMVLRTFTGNDNRPRDEFISLSGFTLAWEAYRLQSEQPVPAGVGTGN
jgi:invasion protein IalB